MKYKSKSISKIKRIHILLIIFSILLFVLIMPGMSRYALSYPANSLVYFFNTHHFKPVEQELEKLANVEVLRIDTDSNEGVINALVKVKNKGHLSFVYLEKQSFYNTPHIQVNRFGNLQIRSRCYPEGLGMSNVWLDIGFQGKESTFFRFKMNSVQDVIDHYDEIMALIQTWPKNIDDPRIPGIKNKVTEGNADCYFSTKDINE